MGKLFLTDVNLNGNALQNAVIGSVATTDAISNPKAGWIVLDESDSRFKYYNGTAWIAGAKYEAKNAAADVANKRYGIFDKATEGVGENVGTTSLTFRAIAVSDAEALTLAMNSGVITLGLKLDGATLTQSAAGLKVALSIKKLAAAAGEDAATYELQDAEGNRVGDQINIAKDKFLKEVVPGHANDTFNATTGVVTAATENPGDSVMHFIFFKSDEDGKFGYSIADVNLQKFLEETEFDATKGLVVENHIVGIKIAADSEELDGVKVLAFGADGGLKIAGIAAAIEKAVLAGSSEVVVKDGEKFIKVEATTDATTGKTTYTLSTTDVASAALLGTTADDDTKTTAFGKVAKLRKDVEAYTVNGKKVSANPTLDATDVKLSADYVEAENAEEVAAEDQVEVAVAKLQAQIKANTNGMTQYKHVIEAASVSPVTIAAATHKCGKFVTVSAYLNGDKVEVGVNVSAAGDVKISWNGSLAADLVIVIVGDNLA